MTNQATKEERYCRVCGLDQDEEGVRTVSGRATFFICDCCGVEFGYEDALEAGYDPSEYRKEWLFDKQAKWRDKKYKPDNWSLCEQLKQIPDRYKDAWVKIL